MFKKTPKEKVENDRSSSLIVPNMAGVESLNPDGGNGSGEQNLPDFVQKKKSVTFNEKMLEERFEFDDDEESQMGRKLYWEFYAVDRQRFKDRIERLESVLTPILASEHRDGVFTHRSEGVSSSSASLKSQFVVEEVSVVIISNEESR